MKKIIAISLTIACAASIYADTLKGRITDDKGNPVEYATIVLLKDSLQAGGTVADSIGNYSVTAAKGNYRLQVSSVGYELLSEKVSVNGTTTHNAVLKSSSVMMKEVNVTASAIRREADRFVMSVENMPGAIGKDGEELLRDAPGVWINDDKISINGKSGTKVYVNDREMKMSDEQLMNFLRSLKAEEVTKVEIIPMTGAEYSADSAAGIIKITMKKARTDGLMGSVGVRSNMSEQSIGVSPNGSLNIKKGNWSYNLSGSVNLMPKMETELYQSTDYANGNKYISNGLSDIDKSLYGFFNGGIFYDPNKSNSFGLEIFYNRWKYKGASTNESTYTRKDAPEEKMKSIFGSDQGNNNINATFNYIHRFDSIGTNLKFITGYNNSQNDNKQNNEQGITQTQQFISKSDNSTDYDVANLSLDFDKIFSSKWNLSTGAKYTFNKMRADATNWYMNNGSFIPDPTKQDYDYDYNENILGIYAKGSFNAKHISVVAGLRGEYTKTRDKSNSINQTYFDLFPNAYLTYKFDDFGQHSLTASFSRYISRPSFWALNPTRVQASDYFYQSGNPDLKATYKNNIALTAVLKYKYSLTVWTDITQQGITQGAMADKDNPDNVIFTNVNIDTQRGYGATVNLPFQITKWLSLNANVTYIHGQEKISADSKTHFYNCLYISTNAGIQLPADFYIRANYFGTNRYKSSTMTISPMHSLGVGIKKSFANKKWTASFGVMNILGKDFEFTTKAVDGSYVSKQVMKSPITFSLSLTYNFNVGEMFNAKKIISNADDSRTAKGSNTK